jgi:hypothetical protein
MQKPDLLPLTDGDWQQTPLASQALIVALWNEVQQLRSEVASLGEQVNQTSNNSSRPPVTRLIGFHENSDPDSFTETNSLNAYSPNERITTYA